MQSQSFQRFCTIYDADDDTLFTANFFLFHCKHYHIWKSVKQDQYTLFLFLFKVDSQEAEVLGICNGGVDLNIHRLCKKSERKEALGVLLDLSSLI